MVDVRHSLSNRLPSTGKQVLFKCMKEMHVSLHVSAKWSCCKKHVSLHVSVKWSCCKNYSGGHWRDRTAGLSVISTTL